MPDDWKHMDEMLTVVRYIGELEGRLKMAAHNDKDAYSRVRDFVHDYGDGAWECLKEIHRSAEGREADNA